MTSLVLDLGNTAAKYGCFGDRDGQLRESGLLAGVAELPPLLARLSPARVIVSAVTIDAGQWLAALGAAGVGEVRLFEPGKTAVPLASAYATPHTLGADRLAAAVGAAGLRPNQPTLIMDAGTAIKFDLLTADNTFQGGSIGPGLRMRLRALHQFTGRLPDLDLPLPADAVQLTGTDTASAMRSGVLNGAVFEAQGFLDVYARQQPGLGVLLTGGDAPYFATRLQGRIFVVPELVLLGLYRILSYHAAI